jgi:CBS domain-containing protein
MELKVKNIMTSPAITIRPEASLEDVLDILSKNNFDGLPVVDKNNVLLGIVTQYDLLTKGSSIHIPTVAKIFKEFKGLSGEKTILSEELSKIEKLVVSDVMNKDPLFVGPSTTVETLQQVFTEHHRVNPIPVLDENKKVIGVVSRYDILKLQISPELDKILEKSQKDILSEDSAIKISSGVVGSLKSVQNQFVLVSKWRTRFWYIFASILFLVGFAVAFFLIVRLAATPK